MSISMLGTIISILFFALTTGMLFRYLRISSILGYLIIGALAGPHAMALIPDEVSINVVAEFGIVFLMFTVGLEFSLPKLIDLRYWVFGVGGLQVVLGILITTLIGVLIGMTPVAAFAVGGIVVMSSTAVVIKELSEHNKMETKIGKNSIGILLAQDLAVIPFIILLASFSGGAQASPIVSLGWAVVNGIFAFILLVFSKRWFLNPLFRVVTAMNSRELFTFLVLFVALGTSWLTYKLGLSYALGAFLAGVMLSETPFKHQIEMEVRPFRDVLLALFFITIGMLVDVSTWASTWVWIVLLVAALLIFKTGIIALLSRLAGDDAMTASRTGLILANGGEFGFVILTFSLNKQLFPMDYGQVILAALWISILISPLLIRYNKAIARLLLSPFRI